MTRFIVFLMLIFMSLGCKKNDSKTNITISSISDITATEATIIGELVVNNSVLVISKGICWSKFPKPVYADSKISNGTDPGSFTGIITGLTSSTKYYVRAYVITKIDTFYSNDLSFTTEEMFKTITDTRDGQTYKTVKIGKQTWFAENLRYSGNLPEVKSDEEWKLQDKPAWCYWENKMNMNNLDTIIYGKLYNWYAVNESNVCPVGWHVPSDDEWNTLSNHLGGDSIAGQKMKNKIEGWIRSDDLLGRNESGFSAVGGGSRSAYGTFSWIIYFGYYWSSTEKNANYAWIRYLFYNRKSIDRVDVEKRTGLSIRCIKD